MDYAIDKRVTYPCEFVPPKHIEDAGLDIRWGYDFDVEARQISMIDTGISIDIPKGWLGLIVPRSSNNTLTLANESGIIDSTYTGNIKLKVMSKSGERINVYEEDKHFQLIIIPHMMHNLNKVDKITKESTRGADGFGSTD